MPRRAADRPNVVYIDCHDLGDWLGCYGRPYLETPHLDGLAAGGVRFATHTATAPICMPSRASIFTGLMPHEVGVTGQEALDPAATCMAARFRDAGYRTVACGGLKISQCSAVGWVLRATPRGRWRQAGCRGGVHHRRARRVPAVLSLGVAAAVPPPVRGAPRPAAAGADRRAQVPAGHRRHAARPGHPGVADTRDGRRCRDRSSRRSTLPD